MHRKIPKLTLELFLFKFMLNLINGQAPVLHGLFIVEVTMLVVGFTTLLQLLTGLFR